MVQPEGSTGTFDLNVIRNVIRAKNKKLNIFIAPALIGRPADDGLQVSIQVSIQVQIKEA